jgi:hypothetical protein
MSAAVHARIVCIDSANARIVQARLGSESTEDEAQQFNQGKASETSYTYKQGACNSPMVLSPVKPK